MKSAVAETTSSIWKTLLESCAEGFLAEKTLSILFGAAHSEFHGALTKKNLSIVRAFGRSSSVSQDGPKRTARRPAETKPGVSHTV